MINADTEAHVDTETLAEPGPWRRELGDIIRGLSGGFLFGIEDPGDGTIEAGVTSHLIP